MYKYIIPILLLYSVDANADASYFTYYLTGQIFAPNGNPLANTEVLLVNKTFSQYFMTDNAGNYKLEISIFRPCLSGPPDRNFYDSVALEQAYKYNDSFLKFKYKDGSAIVESEWRKYYYDTSYQYDSGRYYVEEMNIFLRDTILMTAYEEERVKNNIMRLREEINKTCRYPTDTLEKVKRYIKERYRIYIAHRNNDTSETLPIVEKYNNIYMELFHVDGDYRYLIDMINLKNRPIDKIAGVLGVCEPLLRLEQQSKSVYYLYHSYISDYRKEVIQVNEQGIIIDYYESYD